MVSRATSPRSSTDSTLQYRGPTPTKFRRKGHVTIARSLRSLSVLHGEGFRPVVLLRPGSEVVGVHSRKVEP